MPARNRYRSAAVSGVFALAVLLALLGSGCALVVEREVPPQTPVAQDDAEFREEPRSRYGNPESYEVFGKRYYTLKTSEGFRERGVASWYGKKFHGRRTSSGETYDMYQMTAAHKALPLPSYVRVTNLENGRNTILKVNDRGPFHDNRVIDLSYAAALKLGVVKQGTALVEIEAIGKPSEPQQRAAGLPAPALPQSLFLQVGAFSERPNAERLSAEIGKYMPDRVRVHEFKHGGQAIYRVQVGPIATADSADQLVATLTGLGIAHHHFVTN